MTTPIPDDFNPLMLDIPQQLETERLLLCVPQAGFGTIIHATLTESAENLKRWFAWAKLPLTIEETEADVRQAVVQFYRREKMRFYIFRKEDGVFMGGVEMLPHNWHVPSFGVEYWVSSRFEGKGFATEAVNGLTHFAFKSLKAKRVEIRCDARNHRSTAVAERAGFLYEGTRHWDSRDVEGKLSDTLVYVRFN